MSQEDTRELEISRETSTKPKKKKIFTRIIAFILAATVTLTSTAAYIFRNNIKVRTSETSEIETLINNDNVAGNEDEPRDIVEETKSNLTKIETYLKLSNTLDTLYRTYNGIIKNLSLGEAIVEENAIVELTDKEYQELCTNLEQIANSKKQDDQYYQAIKKVVSYSSAINAWLSYNAPKMIYATLLDNCTNDVANGLGLDFQRITINYNSDNKQLMITRNDNGVGEATYDISASGIRFNHIIDVLEKTTQSYTEMSDFIISGESKKYDQNGNCLITLSENGGLIVPKNSALNKEINNHLDILKIVACSTYEIKNSKFKYDFAIPSPETSSEETTKVPNMSKENKNILALKR